LFGISKLKFDVYVLLFGFLLFSISVSVFSCDSPAHFPSPLAIVKRLARNRFGEGRAERQRNPNPDNYLGFVGGVKVHALH